MNAAGRQARDSELIQYATEIKVRAERRCGELLRDSERNTGVRMNGPDVERCDTRAPTLADIGLTRDQSSRYQQLAAMPGRQLRDCRVRLAGIAPQRNENVRKGL